MMSQTSEDELLKAVRPRRRQANRTEKRQMLDELVAVTRYHRSYAIQVLNHPPRRKKRKKRTSQTKYQGPLPAVLEQIWRTANCILLKRVRERSKPHGLSATKPGTLLKHTIPIRTSTRWDDAQPGFEAIREGETEPESAVETDNANPRPSDGWPPACESYHTPWNGPLARCSGGDLPKRSPYGILERKAE
jgi:hypothetical protein